MLDDADDSDDCDDADEDLSRLQATDAAGEAGIGVGVSSDQGMVIKHLFANPTPVRTPLHISKCRWVTCFHASFILTFFRYRYFTLDPFHDNNQWEHCKPHRNFS